MGKRGRTFLQVDASTGKPKNMKALQMSETQASANIKNDGSNTVSNSAESKVELAVRRDNEEAVRIAPGSEGTFPLSQGQVLIIAAVTAADEADVAASLNHDAAAANNLANFNNPDPDAVEAGRQADVQAAQQQVEADAALQEKQIADAAEQAAAHEAAAQASAPANVTNPDIGTSTGDTTAPAAGGYGQKTDDEILAELQAEEDAAAAARNETAPAAAADDAEYVVGNVYEVDGELFVAEPAAPGSDGAPELLQVNQLTKAEIADLVTAGKLTKEQADGITAIDA